MQNDNYRQPDSFFYAFRHSCLGKLIILLVIIGVFAIIAMFTRPSDSMMLWQTEDNIKECLIASDSIQSDAIDDYVHNLGNIFTVADSMEVSEEVRKAYHMYNRLEVYRHTFYATAYLKNNLHPEGVRVGFGAFGLIVPTVLYKDILLDVGPVHKGYNQKIIKTGVPDTDLGSNPNIQEFHYKRNPDD